MNDWVTKLGLGDYKDVTIFDSSLKVVTVTQRWDRDERCDLQNQKVKKKFFSAVLTRVFNFSFRLTVLQIVILL